MEDVVGVNYLCCQPEKWELEGCLCHEPDTPIMLHVQIAPLHRADHVLTLVRSKNPHCAKNGKTKRGSVNKFRESMHERFPYYYCSHAWGDAG